MTYHHKTNTVKLKIKVQKIGNNKLPGLESINSDPQIGVETSFPKKVSELSSQKVLKQKVLKKPKPKFIKKPPKVILPVPGVSNPNTPRNMIELLLNFGSVCLISGFIYA